MKRKGFADIIRHRTPLSLGFGILLLCIIFLLTTGESPEQKLIDRYFKAFETNDTKEILDLFYKPIVERESDSTALNAIRYLKDVDKFYGRYGDNVKEKTISNIQYFDKDLLDFYNDIYFDESANGVEIKDGCEITVEIMNANGNEYTMRFHCFKIKGKWYLYSINK